MYPITLTISQDGCQRSHNSSVEVIENPISNFSFDKDSACVPFTVNFYSKTRFADEPTYTWHFGDGNTSNLAFPTHTYKTAGTYDVSLLVENDGRCKDTSLKVLKNAIAVLSLPIAKFRVDKTEMSKFDAEIKIIDGSFNSSKVEYYPMEGIQLIGPNQFFHFPDTGHYSIMQVSYNDYGCSDTSYLQVIVYDEFHIYIPNAFTPNGDGINEFYMPVVSGVDSYLFQVFNRWGELIFETNDRLEGWNGKRNGVMSQFGNYVYRIETENQLGKPYSYKGSFALIR